MKYIHFLMLAGRIDVNERRRACYLALAFNKPEALAEDADEETVYILDDLSKDELLAECNGKT